MSAFLIQKKEKGGISMIQNETIRINIDDRDVRSLNSTLADLQRSLQELNRALSDSMRSIQNMAKELSPLETAVELSSSAFKSLETGLKLTVAPMYMIKNNLDDL